MDPRAKILIVDDSPPNLDVLTELLSPDYSLIVALDGETGLDLARRVPGPDLILLDILLPGLSGFEVCQKLKEDPVTSPIPVIFLTGLQDDFEESRGLALGAVDFIKKPFIPLPVKSRIRNHLELKLHRDNLEALVSQRTASLRLTQDITIFGLGILAEYRDTETGDHIQRTKGYVRILADALKAMPRFSGYFDQATTELLVKSAPLHDIGKVSIPDHILRKPGPLTAQEFEIMKGHTTAGRDIIHRMREFSPSPGLTDFLRITEEITFTHHEKWDGSGYHGLKGDEIPVPGRLMTVADIYDALISPRVYKPAMEHDAVVELIRHGDGRTRPEHFDPDVLQAFLDHHRDFADFAAMNRTESHNLG